MPDHRLCWAGLVPQVAKLPDFPDQDLLTVAAPVFADCAFTCLARACGCLCGWLLKKLDCTLVWPAGPVWGYLSRSHCKAP